MKLTTFVAMDVHKATITVATAKVDRGDAKLLGTIPYSLDAVDKLVRKLGPKELLAVCYEAGPCGYELYRYLRAKGIRCDVIAPSLVPEQPGKRVKTDRRDAKKLARLYRSGELTPVWVPDEDHEALRDLTRARQDAQEDVKRKQHQLQKLLLRLGYRPPEGVRTWTTKHRKWLESLKLPRAAQQIVLADYIHALDEATARVDRLQRKIEEQARASDHASLIAAFQALRGIAVLTSTTLVAELGDLTRFPSARQAMDYVGLVPSEYSSGASRQQGGITKCGNAHARRVLVEAAWHYLRTPYVGTPLKKRQEGLPEEIKAIAWKAQHRLNLKFRRLLGRGKPKQKAVVAVARELVGFIWAIAHATQKHAAVKVAA